MFADVTFEEMKTQIKQNITERELNRNYHHVICHATDDEDQIFTSTKQSVGKFPTCHILEFILFL